jgi:hypothetical protein
VKVIILFVSVILSPNLMADSCDDNVVAYNANYASQKASSEARKFFNGDFSRFLTDHTPDDSRNVAYYLSSKLFHPQSNDDNLIELSELLKSGKPIKGDDDAVVRGHSLLNLSLLNTDQKLKEMAKFLYIQVVTNADLKRASSNLNDLASCPAWHVFKSLNIK